MSDELRDRRAEERARDKILIDRACAGDRDAFQDLFGHHRHKVYKVAYGLCRNQEDALDVVQDTFLKAQKALPRFEGRSSVGTWLCQIATHRAIDLGRRQKVRRAETLEEGMVPSQRAGSSPREQAQASELKLALEAALRDLSEKHRAVFVLYTVQQLSYKEIAATLEVSIGTVMSRLFYARKNLQEALAEFAPPGGSA